MSTENLVQKCGWFGARMYRGKVEFVTPAGGTVEAFVRIPTGSFRPKYVISAQVGKKTVDATTGVVTIEDSRSAFVDLSFVAGKDGDKTIYNDYAKLFIGGTAPASWDGYVYEILLME